MFGLQPTAPICRTNRWWFIESAQSHFSGDSKQTMHFIELGHAALVYDFSQLKLLGRLSVTNHLQSLSNGVYSLKWRLTDRYLRWGTLADPRPGRGHSDQCKSSEFLQELRISGFPRFGVSPTCFRAK